MESELNTSPPAIEELEQPSSSSWLKSFLLVLFLAAFTAGGFYFGAWALAYRISDAGKVPSLADAAMKLNPLSDPDKDSGAAEFSKGNRINILVMGVDKRPGDEMGDLTRTDTMMVLTLDPQTKNAGVLSIPRDLWVPIPLKEGAPIHDRINAAHVYGDLYKYPGGGPALAMQTVQYNFGVRIHHYMKIDFDGFQRIIDALGGVTVELKEPLIDNQYPTPDYGTMKIYIPEGVQRLNGEKALWFARSRHMDSDLGRIKRQQQLLLALREEVLQLNILPKIPKLWNEFHNAVDTDMRLPEIIGMAMVAKDVRREAIITRSVDANYIRPVTAADGAYLLVPVRERIRELIGEVFFDSKLRQEDAQVLILNGTSRTGLAAKVADRLRENGFTKVEIGDVDGASLATTTQIYDHSGKTYSLQLLADILKVPPSRVITSSALESSGVDIRVVLGSDALFN